MACATPAKYVLRFVRSLLPQCSSRKDVQIHTSIGLSSTQRRYLSGKKSSKFPEKPIATPVPAELVSEVPEIDLALVEQLERMSLVEFANEKGLQELRKAVRSANQLLLVDTEGVEPLDSVLEARPLWLREDKVTEGNCVEEILSNASKVEEQYFVAPPGNIPLKRKSREHFCTFLENEPKKEYSDS